MIEHIAELSNAGIGSFKIEGRAKSAYYTAVVTNAYRLAVDDFRSGKPFDRRLLAEMEKVSHRAYCTGFYYGPIRNGQDYSEESYRREWDVIAVVEQSSGGAAVCRQRNRFAAGETAEVLEPGEYAKQAVITAIRTESGEQISEASEPDGRIVVELPFPVKPYSVLRKKIK